MRAALLALVLGPALFAATFETAVSRIETRMGGRIGVFAQRGGVALNHHGDERFAYCSTFKWLLAATVLHAVDQGKLDLDRRLSYHEADLVGHSPVTRAHLAEGAMTVAELCAAAVITSDNGAANLLEPLVGGPAGLQASVRGLGDPVTRFDRIEPELNSNLPGDPRDTSSARAMVFLLKQVLAGDVLTRTSRSRLLAWMKATETGAQRIRAGVPKGWVVADKTGTSGQGAVNDMAIILPPSGEPVFLCVFTNGGVADDRARERAIAEVTRQVLRARGFR